MPQLAQAQAKGPALINFEAILVVFLVYRTYFNYIYISHNLQRLMWSGSAARVIGSCLRHDWTGSTQCQLFHRCFFHVQVCGTCHSIPGGLCSARCFTLCAAYVHGHGPWSIMLGVQGNLLF